MKWRNITLLSLGVIYSIGIVYNWNMDICNVQKQLNSKNIDLENLIKKTEVLNNSASYCVTRGMRLPDNWDKIVKETEDEKIAAANSADSLKSELYELIKLRALASNWRWPAKLF
jgi:predicted Holliday junction resolvase-like endonuclease